MKIGEFFGLTVLLRLCFGELGVESEDREIFQVKGASEALSW